MKTQEHTNRTPRSTGVITGALFLLLLPIPSLSITDAQEVKLGQKLYEEITSETPIYEDPALIAYVDKIGQRMAEQSGRSNLEYHFTVMDDFDVNAYATPGGFIYVNRGLLLYLTSEAQLAAVLGHEVGHVDGRHYSRQKTASTGSLLLTIASVFTTGSADAAEAAQLLSQAAISGYGREMELEADGYGAKYLRAGGYDPAAMLEVINVLKNHSRFRKQIAKAEGTSQATYHGVFATHPRYDQRLREVISEAGEALEDTKYGANDEFRMTTEGLLYGGGTQPANYEEEPDRYTDKVESYSMKFPEGWEVTKAQKTIAKPEDEDPRIEIEVMNRQNEGEPSEFIKNQLNIDQLFGAADLRINGLKAHGGVVPTSGKSGSEQMAVVFSGQRAYVIRYYSDDKNVSKEFQEIVSTFKPFRTQVASSLKQPRIKYVVAKPGLTYSKLAKVLYLGKYGEEQLRIINDAYPHGEPEAGEWVKIVQ
jgi:predicted Zn-dependent protease